MNIRIYFLLFFLSGIFAMNTSASEREKYNFNPGWLLHVGDIRGAEKANFSDSDWKQISLPRAFNEDEALKSPSKK